MLTILFALCWAAPIGYPVLISLVPLSPPGQTSMQLDEGAIH